MDLYYSHIMAFSNCLQDAMSTERYWVSRKESACFFYDTIGQQADGANQWLFLLQMGYMSTMPVVGAGASNTFNAGPVEGLDII